MPNITILTGEVLCSNPFLTGAHGSYHEPTADNEESVSYKALSFTLYSQQIGYFFFQQSSRFQITTPLQHNFSALPCLIQSLYPLCPIQAPLVFTPINNTSSHHDTSFTIFMSKYTYHSYAACKDPFTCARTHYQVTQYPSTRNHATTTASQNPSNSPRPLQQKCQEQQPSPAPTPPSPMPPRPQTRTSQPARPTLPLRTSTSPVATARAKKPAPMRAPLEQTTTRRSKP